MALDNATLLKEMTELQQAFIQLLANALDAKSPYTGGHCQRVPELAQMLTEAANSETTGIFKDFNLSEEDRYELYVASWMHDCGKVVTPSMSSTNRPSSKPLPIAFTRCACGLRCSSAMPKSIV